MASFIFDAVVSVNSDTIETRNEAEMAVQIMLNDYFDMTDDSPTINIKLM